MNINKKNIYYLLIKNLLRILMIKINHLNKNIWIYKNRISIQSNLKVISNTHHKVILNFQISLTLLEMNRI